MGFTRNWDASCPRVWDAWVAAGTKWVIQDLAPEDEETAIQILVDHLLDDETLSRISKVKQDPDSLQSYCEFWRQCFMQRMSLGCYTEIEGKKTLVGLNVCIVELLEEKSSPIEIKGDNLNNVYRAYHYTATKCEPFKYLGEDQVLNAIGLVVKKEHRGQKLGSRILAAREPLCLSQGVKATATLFTTPASQRSAEKCGFETICVTSLKEFAEQGLNYPFDDSTVVKMMVKKYS